ncbi:MAG: hypothetical protein BIFFINMI_00916 [Phycisphaerae bacterium]|nr:hypothetical protein [Phycisphaerae bacterium]
MKRWRRWAWRVARGLAVATIVVLGLWLGLVPTILEHVIAARVEGFGLARPSFRVAGYSLSHVEIGDLSVGQDDRLRIGSVRIEYRASRLLHKQVDSIEIIGLEALIRRKAGVWDFGPLAGLHGPAGGGTPGQAPFRRITLRASTLTVDLEGRRLRIPISGSVESAGASALSLDLTAVVEGAALQLTGVLDTGSQDFALALAGDAPDLGRALAAVAPSIAAALGQPREGMAATVTLVRNNGVLSLDATAQGAGWQLSRFTLSATGLEDWLRGEIDVADVQIQGEAAINTWLMLRKSSSDPRIAGKAAATTALSAIGTLQLRRTRTGSQPGWTWSATAPTVRATVAPCDLSIAASGIAIKGVSADLRMTATADATRLRVNLLPDSWITVASADVPASGRTETVGSARFVIKERENQPLLAVTLEGGRPVAALAALVAEADAPVSISAGDGTTAKVAAVRSEVEGVWNDGSGTLAGSLRISGIDASFRQKLGDGLLVADVSGASLLATSRRDFPPGREPEAPLPIEFVFRTTPGSPGVSATVAGIEATSGVVEVRGTIALSGGAPPAVSARVSLANASVRQKDAGLTMTGLEGDVPIAWNAPAGEPGRLVVKSIELKGAALPSLAGTLSVADTRADFTVDWEPLAGAKLRAEGSAAFGARGPSARAYVSVPLFEITDPKALGRLVPPLKGLLATGSFALDGYVRLSGNGLSPNIALTILDGEFKSEAWKAEAEGVFATVRLNSFRPLLTPRKEFQVALVRHATIGKLDVKDGFVAFRLEPVETDGRATGWTAYVQRGECGWVGGRLYVEDFRFDPAARTHTATVYARDLKLGALLALIPGEKVAGVGSLDGELPVTIGTWPDVRFGEGELCTPPGQPGWFKVKNSEVLGTVLENTDPRFKTDSLYVEMKKRLVNAFRDFEFDELSVVFAKDAGKGFVARVNTRGRARTGDRQEFEKVTLNFLDFDKVLRDAILISTGISDAETTRPPGKGDRR